MYELPLPEDNPFDIFSCIKEGDKFKLLLRKEDFCDSVTFFDTIYRIKGKTASLNTLPVLKKAFTQTMTKDEMEKLYKNRLYRSKSGNVIYTRIRDSAIGDLCPLCSQRLVGTLDHYLPKAHYPQYAISRVNLYPACIECNKAKLDTVNSDKENQTFHPFFDRLHDIIWLSASLKGGASPALVFYVNDNVPQRFALRQRMRYHFRTLGIDDLYATHAASALSQEKFTLQELFKSKGRRGVEKYLKNRWESACYVNKNSWLAVMYCTLLNSASFCAGGFNNIAVMPIRSVP